MRIGERRAGGSSLRLGPLLDTVNTCNHTRHKNKKPRQCRGFCLKLTPGSGFGSATHYYRANKRKPGQQHGVGFWLRDNSDLQQLPANFAARKAARAGCVNVHVGKVGLQHT